VAHNTALVIGEHCYDNYIVGSVSRLNPEAPSPILTGPFSKRIMDGMASNVAANIVALVDKVIRIDHAVPIIKTRFCDKTSGYILLRYDELDSATPITDEKLNRAISCIKNKEVDYVVISDYNKGFLSEKNISLILDAALENQIPTFLDTKKILGDWSKNAFCVKINKKEYDTNIQNSQEQTLHTFYGKFLVVTHGSEYTKLFKKEVKPSHLFAIEKGNIINVCGAGDSVLAGLSFKYAKSKNILFSIQFGNTCGTIACQYFGTHVFNKKDLEEIAELNPV
jgi:D-beta-D-heptose 7-phosphate kinase/D-beta-D-heptose 1-phosphate adenosyltransferase